MVPFLIRLFSGVNAHVTSEVGGLSKSLLAYLEPVLNVTGAYCVAVQMIVSKGCTVPMYFERFFTVIIL